MGLKERIKDIRIAAGLSQRAFSERINISQGTLALFESGKRTPRDIHIAAICREFRINEDWLRNDTGERQSDNDAGELARLLTGYQLDPLAFKMVELFVSLTEQEMKWVLDKVRQLSEAVAAVDAPADSSAGR